jgi:hypothetical protein
MQRGGLLFGLVAIVVLAGCATTPVAEQASSLAPTSSEATLPSTDEASAVTTACTTLRDQIQALYDSYNVPGAADDDETTQFQSFAAALNASLAGLDPVDKTVFQNIVGAARDRGAVGPKPRDSKEGLDWALENVSLAIEFGRAVEQAKPICAGIGIDLPIE